MTILSPAWQCLSDDVLICTVKPVLSSHSTKHTKLVFKTDYHLMQVKSITECSKRAFCNTSTYIDPTSVIKIFVLSIFEWPFKTGFTVLWWPIQSTWTEWDSKISRSLLGMVAQCRLVLGTNRVNQSLL